MPDPRLVLWAKTLVEYSAPVRAGQTVGITGGVAAEPLLATVYREVVRLGGHPVMLPTFPELRADLLANGSDAQLAYVSPIERYLREEVDVLVNVLAETNTKSLSQVDPARGVVWQRARTELMATFLRRDAEASLRWTLTLFPTDAFAQDADMATADYVEFVFRAGKLDQPDPAAAWRAQAAEQQRLIDWLQGKREVRLRGPDTDLILGIADRIWINADGTKNFPDGEIFTGPVETATEGHVRFSFPVVTEGREVHDVRLRFVAGKVVDASAAKNEAFLIQTLDTDAGARILGELAFGTNFGIDRFTKNILFDEKIGGTIHMAVGAGYPATGNTNTSAVHWDLICDLRQGGTIEVDGELFLRDGRFVV